MAGDWLTRRKFGAWGAGAALAWPLTARAQQPAMPVVGFVSPVLRDLFAAAFGPFLEGLSETGYVEGRNVTLDYRTTEGRNELLPAVMADLLRRQVTMIVAIGNSQVVAAKAATTTVPIVFLTGEDPVKIGFVASLNKPGGNLTGVNTLGLAVGPKRLELLRELLPAATSVALLVNPTNPISTENQTRDLQSAARALGLQLHVLHASHERDFETVFASLAQLRADAIVILPDGFSNSRTEQLAALTLRHAVPSIFQNREFTAAGGLASYGGSTANAFRLVGVYTGRILRGEKPAELPVQQATKFELIVNLKTAKALGLDVPADAARSRRRGDRMKRREFITLLGGAAAAWPLAARAQQPAMPVIGFLSSGSPAAFAHFVAAFRRGLGEAGFVEDRNVGDRIPLGGGSKRSTAGAGERSGARPGLGDLLPAALRPRWRRRPRRRQSPSFSRAARTRSKWAWWRATTGPAATSPASPC